MTAADLVIDLVQELTQFNDFTLLFKHAVDLLAQPLSREAEVGFEDLTDVHTRRYTQRVEDDIHRSTVGIVRHVFNRHDHGDHTFVTVTTGHLVARLDTTADGKVNLDDLEYTWSKIIALLQLALLVFELVVKQTATIDDVSLSFLELLVQRIFDHAQLEPLTVFQAVQNFIGDFLPLLQASTTFSGTTHQSGTQTFERCAFNNAELFVQVLADLVELALLDGQRTSITLNAITSEDLNVDNGAFGTGRHAQGRVFNVACFFTEDRTQQLLFRGQLGLAFRSDLTYQDVACADFSAYINDTSFIQLVQCCLTHVRDVGSDLFRPELGITRHTGQFLNVDRGEAVFLNNTLGQADGVFEVEAVPRHERDAHVLTQRQFTHIGGRAVSHDVATLNAVTLAHQRTLVDAGILVRTCVFGQVVDVDTGFACLNFVICNTNHDTAGVYRVDHAATTGHDANTGVTRNVALHASTNQRLVSAQCWDSLTLHVRTHQRTVGVVVLKERDQRCRDRYNLLRRNIHQGDVFRRLDGELVQVTNSNQLVNQDLLVVHCGRSLGNDVICFLNSREENNFVSYQSIFNHTVRALEEAVLVGARIGSQGVDQTNVRTFRRFNRAHAPVVSRVYVTDFKASTLTRQTTRAECRDATLVSDLGQRVVLVHEL